MDAHIPFFCIFLVKYLQISTFCLIFAAHFIDMAKQTLYSVGHSNQTIESFLEEISAFGVNCIVDVRSTPYSKFTPQFNAEALGAFLRRHGIAYLPFGNEFGARRTDAVDANGQVDFDMAAKTEAFAHGVERIKMGLQRGFHIAFMCSEAHPLECHRFALVSRYFDEHGYEVIHILNKEQSATHQSLLQTLIKEYVKKGTVKDHRQQSLDLFADEEDEPSEYTYEDQVRATYRKKNDEIGYKAGEADNDDY